MHTHHIHHCYFLIHSRLGVDVATFARLFISVIALAELEFVSGELLGQVRVDKLLLWMLVFSEDDSGCMCLCSVVYCESRQFSENLPGYEITFSVFKHRFCGSNIIGAV